MITATLNTKQVKRAMKNVQKDLKNPRTLLKMVGDNSIKQAERRVQTSKIDPDGRRWAPWAYSTLQRRTREGNAGKGLLYRTGDLLRSFYTVLGRQSVEIRNSQRYAKFLQNGTSNMPRRELLGWGKPNMRKVTESAKKFFGRKWK